MAILTSSVQTFVDLTDQRKLSSYLTSNLPTVQIKDPNTGALNPNWSTSNLKISPVIYLEQQALIPGSTSGLTVAWKRREGSGAEANLISGKETANSDGTLTVSANVLNESASKIITYICRISYADPDTLQTVNVSSEMSFALVQNATNAKVVDIDGEQIFKYDKNGSLVGSTQITLTATAQGVNITQWQYKKSDGTFAPYPTTADNQNITSGSLIVKPSHAVFNNNVATIKITTNDSNISDTITITKLYDGTSGTAGVGGLSVIVGNESQIIPCTNAGTVTSAMDITIPFYGYKGTAITPVTVVVTNLPTGMTIKTNTAGTASNKGTLVLTVAAGSNLGNASVLSGQVTLTFSISGSTVVQYFSWSKSIKGDAGVNSVILTTYTPNGNVIQNGSGQVLIQAVGYNGATQISTGATYSWRKYVSGQWSTIAGATSASITVSATDVVNVCSFECTMHYNGKDYKSISTVIDKTDPCVSEMVPVGGTTFKNGLGGTAVYIIVRRNNEELDPLKGPIKTTAPTSPKAGDFWWEINEEAKTATLKKYSGSAWTTVTTAPDKQSLNYNWYKRDKDGTNDATFNKTGKVIYFTAADVDSIATLQCDVDDGK